MDQYTVGREYPTTYEPRPHSSQLRAWVLFFCPLWLTLFSGSSLFAECLERCSFFPSHCFAHLPYVRRVTNQKSVACEIHFRSIGFRHLSCNTPLLNNLSAAMPRQ